jgi:hypothetical protein
MSSAQNQSKIIMEGRHQGNQRSCIYLLKQIWGIPFDVKDTKAKSRSRLNNCGSYVFHNCISGA